MLDAVAGDQTLFVSTREVRAVWGFIDPIVEGWASGLVPLATYPPDTSTSSAQAEAALAAAGVRGEIGVIGLGKMGAGLARNLLDTAGASWAATGRRRGDAHRVGGTDAAYSAAELVDALEPPRDGVAHGARRGSRRRHAVRRPGRRGLRNCSHPATPSSTAATRFWRTPHRARKSSPRRASASSTSARAVGPAARARVPA